jgi:hypothetical protein
MTRTKAAEALHQLVQVDLFKYLRDSRLENDSHLRATADPHILIALRADAAADRHFKEGSFYWLHPEVGDAARKAGLKPHLTEFRSHTNSIGLGSLHLVIDQTEVLGRHALYADVDKYGPYSDLVGMFGHLLGEVIPNKFRRRDRPA